MATQPGYGPPHRHMGVVPSEPDEDDTIVHLQRQGVQKDEEIAQLKRDLEAAKAASDPTSGRRSSRRERSRGRRPSTNDSSQGQSDDDSAPTDASQPDKEVPSRKKGPNYWARRKEMVRASYAARIRELEVYRGTVVRPINTRWFDLFKPRLIAFALVYAINVLLAFVLFWTKKPLWRFIPRPGLIERWMRAVKLIRAQQFRGTKFVAVFSLKGGIGKTTLTIALATLFRLVYTTLVTLVEDCNLDSGTLDKRVNRNNEFSMEQAIPKISTINSLADLQKYCTALRSGLLVLVMGGFKFQNAQQLSALHEKFKQFVSLVYNDLGTSTESPSNEAALQDAHQVVIPTTPARDSIDQAAKTLAWLQDGTLHNQQLAQSAIVVINRWWPFWWLFSRPSKVRRIFIDAMAERRGYTSMLTDHYEKLMGEDKRDAAKKRAALMARKMILRDSTSGLQNVRFVMVGSSLWLMLGLRVDHIFLPLRVRVQLQEINAMAAQNMSDTAAIRKEMQSSASNVPAGIPPQP